jgi:hypothetical protein
MMPVPVPVPVVPAASRATPASVMPVPVDARAGGARAGGARAGGAVIWNPGAPLGENSLLENPNPTA